MPIENLSNRVKVPRIGKIHLGVKDQTTKDGHPIDYPKATDYFVVPDEVREVYGDKPVELDIMLPAEDAELFAPQYLKAYSLSQGLICRGDGIKATRKIDLKTGALADSKTGAWDWREVNCDPQECELYLRKQCRQVMNLLVLLPKVPGLGVYQIDTSSYHSIVNINSMVRLLKAVLGRCSMIPLTLVLRPQEVAPQGTTKKTVHVLDIRQNTTLADLAKQALLPPARVLMPEVTEEIPEDLYPASIIGEGSEQPATEKKESPKTRKVKQPPTQADRDTAKREVIGRIHTEAKNIDENHYETVIRPRVKITFGTDDLMALTAEQLGITLDWMIGKPNEQDKKAFILNMKTVGFSSKTAVLAQLKKYTNKTSCWTTGELDKTLVKTKLEKEKEDLSNSEVQNFLDSEE